MTEVVFHQPVLVGDVVSFYATVTRIGNTSITVHVDVEARTLARPGGRAEGDRGRHRLRQRRQKTPADARS